MGDPARVELLALDVDGVLTDGCFYVGSDGTDFRRFHIRDGMGIRLFHEAGLRVAIISGYATESTMRRFSRLGVEDIHVGVESKLPVFLSVLKKYGLEPQQAAAMGDDLLDMSMLQAAGFAVTVPGGHAEVKNVADLITEAEGGQGAVREVIEHILKSQGKLEQVLARYRD